MSLPEQLKIVLMFTQFDFCRPARKIPCLHFTGISPAGFSGKMGYTHLCRAKPAATSRTGMRPGRRGMTADLSPPTTGLFLCGRSFQQDGYFIAADRSVR